MVQELTTIPSPWAMFGKGLSEQIPKEVENYRLRSGLESLGNQQGLSNFQRFAALASLPGVTPQMIQSGSDLLRQEEIINNFKKEKSSPTSNSGKNPYVDKSLIPASATTAESTSAALNPYIPPSGPQQEEMSRRLLAEEPQVYPDIDSARAAVSSQIAANVNQSNAKLAKRELEESVQNRAEQKLRDEIATRGAQIPGRVLSNLQRKAVSDIASGKLSPDDAKVKYGEAADDVSKDFSNIRSWGNLGLITKNANDLINSMKILQKNAKEGDYQKEAADSLIDENGLTPQFAYATLYPVSDIKSLNEEIKSLPDINPRIEKSSSGPGMAGVGFARPQNANAYKMTMDIAPQLAESMGTEGSPLAVSYELEKKGYDPAAWKEYLTNSDLNLTKHQLDELLKPKPSFFGWLNDWWLKAFSGVK